VELIEKLTAHIYKNHAFVCASAEREEMIERGRRR
jgi:hypothetical protein